MSVNSALVRIIYPRAPDRPRSIGINATIVSISAAAGPTVAAGILAVANWPWLFAINVPVGVVAVMFAWRTLPSNPGSGVKFDILSALMSALSLGFLITAIDGAGHGERIVWVIPIAVIAIGVGAALVGRELSRSEPLVPVDLMRIPLFALSVTTSLCAFTAQSMAVVSLPFLFETAMGLGQVSTGLLMTPWPLMVAIIAPFTGRWADRWPVGIMSGSRACGTCDRTGAGSAYAAGASGSVRYRLADGDLRDGVWSFQHTEQPGDYHFGTRKTSGRRFGDAGGSQAGGADDRRGAGGAGVWTGADDGDDSDTGLRGCDRRGRGGS